DRVAALERLGDRLHEGVDGLTRVALGQVRLLRDLLDEILLRQSLPPDRGLAWTDLGEHPNNGVGYRSTMRVCGVFPQLGGGQERLQPHRRAGELVRASLLPVDDADGVRDPQARLAERLDRRADGAARRDDVLDEADELARLERPLEPVRGAVALGLPADDHERKAAR